MGLRRWFDNLNDEIKDVAWFVFASLTFVGLIISCVYLFSDRSDPPEIDYSTLNARQIDSLYAWDGLRDKRINWSSNIYISRRLLELSLEKDREIIELLETLVEQGKDNYYVKREFNP